MIKTPYKLDLILNLSDNQTQVEPKTISQISVDNSNISIYKNKIYDSETNIYQNKFKSIILNMGINDLFWLVSNVKTGFDLKIKITNKDQINEKNYSQYVLSNGIIGPIFLDANSRLRKFINPNLNELILQTIDYPINSLDDDFISKWKEDTINYEKNIPKIYFYGIIYNSSGDFLSHYYMTKKYSDCFNVIKQTNFEFVMDFFKKLLILLDDIIARNCILRNLDMFSLGFDSENNNIMILKYTNTSIVSTESNYIKKFDILRCYDKKCVGNLTPYYIIDDYYNLKKDWVSRINKSYSLGLVEIILILFYNNDFIFTKVYDFIIGSSIFESQLHYYHFYKRFNSDTNIHNLNLLINQLDMRFCDINPILESTLETIILNLLNKDYDKIFYPNQILELIKKIEESNNEFKIKFVSKENIYNSQNDNYLKTNYDSKQTILTEDNLNIKKTKSDNHLLIPNYEEKQVDDKITFGDKEINFYDLYQKYKLKYLSIKKQMKKKN
jgi:hypothetical protein